MCYDYIESMLKLEYHASESSFRLLQFQIMTANVILVSIPDINLFHYFVIIMQTLTVRHPHFRELL